jgi:hypothetical protein
VLIDDEDEDDKNFSILAPAKRAKCNADLDFCFWESPCKLDTDQEKTSTSNAHASDRTLLSKDVLKLLQNSDIIRKALDDAEDMKVLDENDPPAASLPSAAGLRMYSNSFRRLPIMCPRSVPQTVCEEDEEVMHLLREDAHATASTVGAEGAVAQESASSVHENKITITCQCKLGKVLIKLRPNDPLSKLQSTFLASAVSKGWLPKPEIPAGLRIEFDGSKVSLNETPNSLGLEDEDSIDISWKV